MVEIVEQIKTSGFIVSEPAGPIKTSEKSITLYELYTEFKCWHRNCFPGDHIPNKYEFRSELINRLGSPVNDKWFGITIKTSICEPI